MIISINNTYFDNLSVVRDYVQSYTYDKYGNADDVSVLEEDQGSIVENNLFAYCLNNLVNMFDREGNIAVVTTCILIGAGVGAAIGGGIGVYLASKKYKPKDGWEYWKYVVGYGVVVSCVGALIGWGGGALITKYGVVKAAKSITQGGGVKFKSFSSLKRSLGNAGKGKDWHHIVEQCQIKKTGFSKYWINNSNNVINISKSTHRKISAYYSRKQVFTEGKTFRNWLAGKSFEEQYKWGIKV